MDIFHRHRQSDENGLAATALERALQTPEYRPEALVWKGIEALPQDPKLAFIFLVNAARAFPKRADIHALIGRCLLAQGEPSLACRYLMTAWQKLPEDPSIRMMLWQARSQSQTPASLRRAILAALPDISAPQELAYVLKLLAAQAEPLRTVGVVRYLPDQQEIHGWAIDLGNLKAPASLQLEAGGKLMSISATAPHPLLTAAGLPGTHGGIRIKVPTAIPAVHVRFETGTALLGSPIYAMPAFVPPSPALDTGDKQPVDVLIPVYDGLEETLDCINSALAARKSNRTPHRIVVIEDVTPVPALRKALRVLASKGKVTLIQNPVNLGFIRSMNRAMALSPRHDVVWLNADTRVHGNWLDRLRTVAYSATDIASVTPFTNNGELMSFPASRVSHQMPSTEEQARLDDLARLADSPAVEIETGCGFCLYIKRSAIDSVGYLDEVVLSRGYGEETDWCLRARGLGWRHMGAPNLFVAHQGGISFGEEKIMRVAHNNAILKRRYPDAEARYQTFCLRDPIKPARQALQRARLADLARQTPGFNQLYIQNSAAVDTPLSLAWRHNGRGTRVTLHARLHSSQASALPQLNRSEDGAEPPLDLSLDYQLPGDLPILQQDLQMLSPDELVYGQLEGCPIELCTLPAQLAKPYRIVCHDDQLLSRNSGYDWQRFAQQAQSVHLPWESLRERYATALPDARLVIETNTKHLAPQLRDPRVLLIADDLRKPQLARQWLNLGRRITRERLTLMLLVNDDEPWAASLLATGAVQALPSVSGLTRSECIQMAGCDAVLSLDPTPGAGWRAPALATELGLPLYAGASSVADETGALPVDHLPISLSPA